MLLSRNVRNRIQNLGWMAEVIPPLCLSLCDLIWRAKAWRHFSFCYVQGQHGLPTPLYATRSIITHDSILSISHTYVILSRMSHVGFLSSAQSQLDISGLVSLELSYSVKYWDNMQITCFFLFFFTGFLALFLADLSELCATAPSGARHKLKFICWHETAVHLLTYFLPSSV